MQYAIVKSPSKDYFFAIKAYNNGFYSSLSNPVFTGNYSGPTSDHAGPGAIIDLRIDVLQYKDQWGNPNRVVLTWTAPEDFDDLLQTKPVTAYEIRWSKQPITDNNFGLATLIPLFDGFTPLPPGQKEEIVIYNDDITSADEVFFAVRSKDEKGNVSWMSNVVSTDDFDGDLDLVCDRLEALKGKTSPVDNDSDDDRWPDGYEFMSETDPTSSASWRTTLFSETFVSSLARWKTIKDTSSDAWAVKNTQLRATGLGAYSYLSPIYSANNELYPSELLDVSKLKSFAITYRVKFDKKARGGVIIGETRIEIDPYQIRVGELWFSPTDKKWTGVTRKQWHEVMIIAQETREYGGFGYWFSLFVDGTPVFFKVYGRSKTWKEDKINIALFSPSKKNTMAIYDDFALWPKPDPALLPFEENFDSKQWGTWSMTGWGTWTAAKSKKAIKGTSWAFSSDVRNSSNPVMRVSQKKNKKGLYSFLKPTLLDFSGQDILIKYRVYFDKDVKEGGGLLFRGVPIDVNLKNYGINYNILYDIPPSDEGFDYVVIPSDLAPGKWYDVVFVCRYEYLDSGEKEARFKALLYVDNEYVVDEDDVYELPISSDDGGFGFISNAQGGSIFYDDLEIKTSTPTGMFSRSNLPPVLFSDDEGGVALSRNGKVGATVTFQLKALDVDHDAFEFDLVSAKGPGDKDVSDVTVSPEGEFSFTIPKTAKPNDIFGFVVRVHQLNEKNFNTGDEPDISYSDTEEFTIKVVK